VLDLVGATSSMQQGLDCLVKGGKIVVVGLIGGAISLPIPTIPQRAISIQGSYVGNPAELQALLDLVNSAKVATIPTTVRPLSEANAALDDLRKGKVIGRVVLVP
jgi:alcohol dehydrogenase, propanol-preferring